MGPAIQVSVENKADHICLGLVDDQRGMLDVVASGVPLPIITKQRRGQQLAVLEPLGQGPDHGFPLFDGFLLGERGEKGEHKFGAFFHCIQIIRFKKYPHRRIKVLEPTDQRDTVHQVPGKAGDAFCYNQVIFSLFTGGDHVVKRRAVFQRDPGDPLIGVNMPQTPVGPLVCQLAVVGLLKLEGRQLRVVVGGNAAIRAYTEKPVPESGFRSGMEKGKDMNERKKIEERGKMMSTGKMMSGRKMRESCQKGRRVSFYAGPRDLSIRCWYVRRTGRHRRSY